jgi:hypothetical protein
MAHTNFQYFAKNSSSRLQNEKIRQLKKKVRDFPVPSRDVTYPAGTGKLLIFFYSVLCTYAGFSESILRISNVLTIIYKVCRNKTFSLTHYFATIDKNFKSNPRLSLFVFEEEKLPVAGTVYIGGRRVRYFGTMSTLVWKVGRTSSFSCTHI